MPKKYRYIGPAPTDLACGKVVAPGTTITDVDPKDPYDRDLIDRGLLVEQPSKPKATSGSSQTPNPEGDQ